MSGLHRQGAAEEAHPAPLQSQARSTKPTLASPKSCGAHPQALQKRLILKTEEVAEKDLQLAEAVTAHAELEAEAARLAGPDATKQLAEHQVLSTLGF